MTEQHQQLRAHFTGMPATTPGRYQILFIHEGKANGFTFSKDVLMESAPLWERASVFVDHSFWGQSVRDLGGVLSNAAWSEEFSGLTAELTPAGIDALSVRASRWVATDRLTADESDVGGRIDVELRHAARPQLEPVVVLLEAFMNGLTA